MPDPSRHSSDRNWLESILRHIPGFRGYLEQEYRRESDHLLRQHLADRVHLAKQQLAQYLRQLVDAARLDDLPAYERVRTRLDGLASKLRSAERGYSGALDFVRVREDELEQVYQVDLALVESVVHDGAIGDLVSIVETCNTGSLGSRARQPGWSEMEYQIRDWFNFFRLSCDLPGLNLVHNLDKAAWALREEPPLRAWGMGGRETRFGREYGDAWDHHAIVYEYANGVRMHAYCRQQNGCRTEISDLCQGTKGRCDLLNCRIEGETNWRYEGPDCNRFDLEHVALFEAIRSGPPVNNTLYMARSSMLAIMTTWAGYTGQLV